jgi:hypothetical protein
VQAPAGVPAGAIQQRNSKGETRWKVQDAQGRTLFYDNEGKLISQK